MHLARKPTGLRTRGLGARDHRHRQLAGNADRPRHGESPEGPQRAEVARHRQPEEPPRRSWPQPRPGREPVVSIDPEALLARDQEIEAEVARRTRYLREEYARLTDEGKELARMVTFYDTARRAPVRPPKWTVRARAKRADVGLAVAQITDWHLDEVVRPEEVLGLNAYNRDIARMRVHRWMEKVVTLPREYVTGLNFEGLVLPATGDLFTGDIHAELKETNDDRLLASVLYWMEPVIGVLEQLEKEYPSVYVPAVVGNHGRLSVKPVFKNRVKDNVEWLFWSLVRDRLADRGSKVRVDVSQAMDLNVPLYGRNHLLTHGDQF